MCFNTRKCEKLIAKNDIPVLKVVDNNKGKLVSPVFDLDWKLNEERSSNLVIIKDGFTPGLFRTTQGLYSFSIDSDPLICSLSLTYFGNKLEVYEAIIPEGSEYVVSEDGGQYCSNRLKLIEKIE